MSKALKCCGCLVVVAGSWIGTTAAFAGPRFIPVESVRSTQLVESSPSVTAEASVGPTARSIRRVEASELRRLSNVAGVTTPPGTAVYSNEQSPVSAAYDPGANQRIADDLTLAGGACNSVYYNLGVFGFGEVGGTYNVHTELWTGNPCTLGSVMISGTETDFLNLANDGQSLFLLEATIDPSIAVPGTVWMAVTFSGTGGADAAWILAGPAEIGSTANFFSEDADAGSCISNANCPSGWTCQNSTCQICSLFNFMPTPSNPNPPYSGFWANIHCEVATPPNGACCNGVTCTQTTEAACLSPSVWQGAFTTCQPNTCQTGACCSGTDFESCSDANAATCREGLFRPNTTCAANACGANFGVYENDFATGVFVGVDTGVKWGDDLRFGPGAPCALTAYELQMAGDGASGALFEATVELWTNNEVGTPFIAEDDIPLAPIPGTSRTFTGLPADLTRQVLLAGPFAGVQLPAKVWLVVSTNTDVAGPIFAGAADIGFSVDGFAQFIGNPASWEPGFRFPPNGFDPTNCPGPECIPAGSFRARVWCAGEPPTGACCNDVNGGCQDNVLPNECEGRWMQDATCASEPFDPPCGHSACCFPNPLNPSFIQCDNLSRTDCEIFNGEAAPGLFCADVPSCPTSACLNRPGDCFASHVTGGCDNGFCCERVCAADPFCCSSDWDSTCVTRALSLCSSDQCDDALPIAGSGPFTFDNQTATTDGPPHAACRQTDEQDQISRDVWYCWTANCTEDVYVRTCGQTTVDTRLAIYEGCDCPVSENNLLECNDDACGSDSVQSVAVFRAVAGQQYMVRAGNYPLAEPGTGTFSMSCGPPSQVNCPAVGDCCAGNSSTSGCSDQACCERVCFCDSFCCDVEWDISCATTGQAGSGCGASLLCPATCGECPTSDVAFVDPAASVVDARRPHTAASATPILGIDALQVSALSSVTNVNCWDFCETAPGTSPNGIASVTDNGGGNYMVNLARATLPNTLSRVTYLGTNTEVTLIGHPGNVNGDGFTNGTDVTFLVDALNGIAVLPSGMYSGDIDRSNLVSGADLLDLVGLLIGEGAHPVWNNTAKPVPNPNCQGS